MTHCFVGMASRMSAGERREAVLKAAIVEFSKGGLAGTSTEDIARRAEISQPYLFRLLGTKKELFLASIERTFDGAVDPRWLRTDSRDRFRERPTDGGVAAVGWTR